MQIIHIITVTSEPFRLYGMSASSTWKEIHCFLSWEHAANAALSEW